MLRTCRHPAVRHRATPCLLAGLNQPLSPLSLFISASTLVLLVSVVSLQSYGRLKLFIGLGAENNHNPSVECYTVA